MADKRALSAFVKNFQAEHLEELSRAHLGLVLRSGEEFVGTRALSLSLKFLATSLSTRETRAVVKPATEGLLRLSLPSTWQANNLICDAPLSFVTSQKDLQTFATDAVEYVRL